MGHSQEYKVLEGIIYITYHISDRHNTLHYVQGHKVDFNPRVENLMT